MEIPQEQLDHLEAQAYSEALAQYFEKTQEEGVDPVQYAEMRQDHINQYLADPTGTEPSPGKRYFGTTAVRSIRACAKEELEYPISHGNLSIVRAVTTRLAIEYFRNLRAWLERTPETEDIEKIRTRIATSSALLLRQTEDMIEELKTPRRNEVGSSTTADPLDKLIDFDAVARETEIDSLFGEVANSNHFTGVGAKSRMIIARVQNHSSNMPLKDLLYMLNSDEDVLVFNKEHCREEDRPIARIHTDGTVDTFPKLTLLKRTRETATAVLRRLTVPTTTSFTEVATAVARKEAA